MLSRRSLLGGVAAVAIAPTLAAYPAAAAAERDDDEAVTPEMFGAKGDGVTNDSAAFAALSDHVNVRSGGTISLRPTIYLVGDQRVSTGATEFGYDPVRLLDFHACTKPLRIRGNGATLRCAPGLRYGTFDPATGEATSNPMPFVDRKQVATPYLHMIRVENCSGPVTISDIELDGNLEKLRLGGPFGDVGWQIPAIGIWLAGNSSDEVVRNVRSHHHAQDGMMISGIDDFAASNALRLIDNVHCEYNGRQGCSIIGGRGYVFFGCSFSHTGKAGIASPPGAGLDIEAENKLVRGLSFSDCDFSNNSGCGMVADSGDGADALFTSCGFVGTTNWSAWPNKPHFRFDRCRFTGALVKCFGDEDPDRAVQFHDCSFDDDPAASPTGLVYLEKPNGPIADLWDTRNVLFSGCSFILSGEATLPWSINVLYEDCMMRQNSTKAGQPRGTYRGRNRIEGNVDLGQSSIQGELIVNGRLVPRSG